MKMVFNYLRFVYYLKYFFLTVIILSCESPVKPKHDKRNDNLKDFNVKIYTCSYMKNLHFDSNIVFNLRYKNINRDTVIINDKCSIHKSQLMEETEKLLLNTMGKYQIFLNVQVDTLNSNLELYPILKQSYNQVWEKLSYSSFNINFESLDKNRQKEIRTRIPFRLSEKEMFGN